MTPEDKKRLEDLRFKHPPHAFECCHESTPCDRCFLLKMVEAQEKKIEDLELEVLSLEARNRQLDSDRCIHGGSGWEIG